MSQLHLCKALLTLFAKGELAGSHVQYLAQAAGEDGWGLDDPLAQKLQRAGSFGIQTGHVARDVLRAATQANLTSCTVEPYKFTLSDGKQVSIFLPHEIYSEFLLREGPDRLCLENQDFMVGHGLGNLLVEWCSNPDVEYLGDRTKVGIIGIHGDGVSYGASNRAGQQKGILVLSMNIISSHVDAIKNRRTPLLVLQKTALRLWLQWFSHLPGDIPRYRLVMSASGSGHLADPSPRRSRVGHV